MSDFEHYPVVAGCDCGKDSLSICIMSEVPADLKKFARKHKILTVKATAEGIEQLLSLSVNLYVLEPTGGYSRLWVTVLEQAEKDVRLVNSSRVKFLLKAAGISNKSDRVDCAAIALYGLQNYRNKDAFLRPGLQEIRDKMASRVAISQANRSLKNRIGSRLAYEWPEGCNAWETSKPSWGKGSATIALAIAGKDGGAWVEKRKAKINQSCGTGISPITRTLTEQYIAAQESCKELEEEISTHLSEPYLERYRRVLEPWKMGDNLIATLLPSIYPFERFLGDDKKRIVEYITGSHGQSSKRDRSEAAFKLACGMGLVQHQSGGVERWKAGGSVTCRTAIWQYIKTTVVIGRISRDGENPLPRLIARHQSKLSPWLNPTLIDAVAQATDISPEIAALRIHYEASEKVGNKKEMATASRFIRAIYKALLKEFGA